MERAERGERILDAAGELLLAWGYRRVTIDEIARRAAVGKGTVYLHWKTKDALLLAVVLRAKSQGMRRQLERMWADPRDILPSRMMRASYLEVVRAPVLRALYLGDSDVLGRLCDIAKKELAELVEHGYEAQRQQLHLLRERGLVRTDMEVAHQQYICLATTMGFLMSEALLADQQPDGVEARADALGFTIRAALETSEAPGLRLVAAAAPEIIDIYEDVEELTGRELQRQLRR